MQRHRAQKICLSLSHSELFSSRIKLSELDCTNRKCSWGCFVVCTVSPETIKRQLAARLLVDGCSACNASKPRKLLDDVTSIQPCLVHTSIVYFNQMKPFFLIAELKIISQSFLRSARKKTINWRAHLHRASCIHLRQMCLVDFSHKNDTRLKIDRARTICSS